MRNAASGARQTEKGLSLIELVIALAVIAIGAATISTLTVNSFRSVEDTRASSQTLRDGEACYETLLALHETGAWKKVNGQAAPYDDCKGGAAPDEYKTFTVDSALADRWVANANQRDALEEACEALSCRALDSGSANPSLQFRIDVLENRRLELVVPISEAPGGN